MSPGDHWQTDDYFQTTVIIRNVRKKLTRTHTFSKFQQPKQNQCRFHKQYNGFAHVMNISAQKKAQRRTEVGAFSPQGAFCPTLPYII